ncbi:MAG: helix-turn-helix domain-containing protein [Planctomycetes bacterium]|nr:helix-turn-helix domain-containing protein [Planctomycetota bacterium]
METQLLSRDQAARMLGLRPKTLARWATKGQGRGPRFSRTGPIRGRCLYSESDLRAWLESRKVGRA